MEDKNTNTQSNDTNSTQTDQMSSEPVTETKTESGSTPTPVTAPAAEAPTSKVDSTKFYIGLIVLALVLGAGWWAHKEGMLHMGGSGGSELVDTTLPAVVATVNGTDITAEEFSESLSQTEQALAQQGVDTTLPEVQPMVQEQALSVLINTMLLVTAAETLGTEVSDAEIDEQLAAIEAQFGSEEALEERMGSLGMTVDDLRDDIREQIVVDAYLESTPEFADTAVTEDDITAAYNELSAQVTDLPPLEEIRPQLEAQLTTQRQQEGLGAVVDRLRSEATIELFI